MMCAPGQFIVKIWSIHTEDYNIILYIVTKVVDSKKA